MHTASQLPTTLVLLPGLDGSGLLFQEFVAALGQSVNTLIVSYPPHSAWGYEELTPYVRRLLPTDRPYVLLGESFSGPIAINIASQGAPGLIGLILCCTFAKNPRPQLSSLSQLLPWIPTPPINSMLTSNVAIRLLQGRFATRYWRDRLQLALSPLNRHVIQTRLQSVVDVNVTAHLQKLHIPLLYLRALEDQLVFADSAEWIVRKVSQTKVIDFIAPHFLLQTLPKESAASVLNFMNRCAANRPQ